MSINEIYLVEKRNILNKIRSNNMTLQELRFFSIYLAKINARDTSTRIVRFSLKDFQKIMDLTKLHIEQIKSTAYSLLSKVVDIPGENGGFEAFQLFKRFKVDRDKDGKWYVEIDAHDDALPLMFNFKEQYFKYQLWNVLNLKSINQLRIYEILKQYEKIGEKIVEVQELRDLLGLTDKEYKRYNDFKRCVLDVSKRGLEENTDIKFNFEPYGAKGKGGKVLKLKFTILKNQNYKNYLNLEAFIGNNSTAIDNNFTVIDINTKEAEAKYSKLENLESQFKNKRLFFYSEACDHEFKEKELQVLYNLILKIVPKNTIFNMELEYYDYIKSKYDELNLKATRKPIVNRYAYMKKLLELDLDV